MKILVGYTHTAGGGDAVRLGVRLARALDATLELVMVLTSERGALVPRDAGYTQHVRTAAESWLAEAAGTVPDDVRVGTHVEQADSAAGGLLSASRRLGTTLIVVGGRERTGSVANSLLHASRVPVAVAPTTAGGAGGGTPAEAPLTRVTAAVGLRPGAEEVMRAAAAAAARTGTDLRVLSLVPLDAKDPAAPEAAATANEHAERVRGFLEAAAPEVAVTDVAVATGRGIEDAVRRAEWQPGDLVVVGSSRLASRGRIFLGSTAGKMLRALPVPLVIVPRETELTFDDEETTA
ncbi:universal stress protein [Zhihengliuella sp.]|uniref:universal stress protein n=1 Tax=Zhihengliuella sp. TaxID=1954483 RepID=UPI002811356F|nr:universal stress protein [Zhihengliuella sp.]